MGDVGINSVVAKPVERGVTPPEPKKAEVTRKEIKVERPALVYDDVEKQGLQTPAEVESADIKEIASAMDSLLKKLNTELKLEVDEETNKVIVKIIDGENQEVVRQIPAEEFVELSKRMKEAVGMLFDIRT